MRERFLQVITALRGRDRIEIVNAARPPEAVQADIRALELETDHDDGHTVYEFSWKVGWTEYDYDIDAATGEILSYSQDVDD